MKIIAESAFNHNGSLEYLKELAFLAEKSGADYFTMQLMHVDSFCTKDYSKYQLYKDTEFTKQEWIEVFDYCNSINLPFIACVLEETSFKWALEYGCKLMKIHATDITNSNLLQLIKDSEVVNIILETQCATQFEVDYAIEFLGLGHIEALFSGYSNYPSEVEDLNLNVLDTFIEKYNCKVGFADHSLDTTEIPLMVLAKGASYLEKHITKSRNNRNFDWQVSLYPEEFASMVSIVNHYKKALGTGIKHPSTNEKVYRNIMYKKVIAGSENLKRSDEGDYPLDIEIASFQKDKVVAALVARLKSQRLPKKIFSNFWNDNLITDLFNRINKSDKFKTILATSTLKEDTPLADLFTEKGFPVYRGDAISVIDRLLHLAYTEKAGAIFRVTGDNPFTDPVLMEKMVALYLENDLDYVKISNVPFGVGAELFSTKYLWRLYRSLETTKFSEYLTWYVLKDANVKMGVIEVESSFSNQMVNLSVDYEEDLERCLALLKKIDKKQFVDIQLKDVLSNLEGLGSVDLDNEIKLPQGERIKLLDYIEAFNNKPCVVKEKVILKNI